MLRTFTQPMPAARAFSMASFIALVMTTAPRPRSASHSAVAAVCETVLMSGDALNQPLSKNCTSRGNH
jgi:hypothetical protein